MNTDILAGKWQQIRGQAKQRWGKLTDSDLEKANGKADELAGLLKEKYGYTTEKAHQEIDSFLKEHDRQWAATGHGSSRAEHLSRRIGNMYRDRFVGRWVQFRSDLRRQWSKLTDEDLDQIKGNMEQLVSLVQQKYDYTRDQAQQEVARFMNSHDGRAYQIVRRLPGDMDHEVRRHPWAAVATAMGLGIAIGFLVRPGHASIAQPQVE